jgi:hypothetical protein
MLRGAAFDPDAVKAMIAAYEDARAALGLFDRNDPLTAILANIIEYAQSACAIRFRYGPGH